MFRRHLVEIAGNLSSIVGVRILPPKKKVVLQYGPNVLYEVEVSNLMGEVEMSAVAAWKYQAVSSGLLDKLTNESLVSDGLKMKAWQAELAAETLVPAKACRARINARLARGAISTADDVQSVFLTVSISVD